MKHREILEETERLILRRYVEEDLEDLLEYLSDGEVVKYEPYRPMTPEEAKKDLAWRLGTDETCIWESESSRHWSWAISFGGTAGAWDMPWKAVKRWCERPLRTVFIVFMRNVTL